MARDQAGMLKAQAARNSRRNTKSARRARRKSSRWRPAQRS